MEEYITMNTPLLEVHKNSVFPDKVVILIKAMSVVSSELTKLLKCEIFCHGSSVQYVECPSISIGFTV